jgi:hypothetical protein
MAVKAVRPTAPGWRKKFLSGLRILGLEGRSLKKELSCLRKIALS